MGAADKLLKRHEEQAVAAHPEMERVVGMLECVGRLLGAWCKHGGRVLESARSVLGACWERASACPTPGHASWVPRNGQKWGLLILRVPIFTDSGVPGGAAGPQNH